MLKPEAESLRAELLRLRQEISEREDFLAFVAHELRNPMHALSLQLASARTLAESNGPSGAAIAARIAKTQATLERYIARSTVLLDVAQHQYRHYPVATQRVDVAPLLARILESSRAEADYHGTALRLDTQPCLVDTDPLALEHIVGNLVSNACKHAQCSEVVLTLRAEQDSARIIVSDNGRGISEADQLRVFDKYDRGARPSLGAGSGLGLWIARQLIHALDGTISLESRLNEGCRFVLTLPLTTQKPVPNE